eukprot:PhM_4_TR7882/c0_g1_i1/m.12814
MNVALGVERLRAVVDPTWDLQVDNERRLNNVHAAGNHIRCDQNAGLSLAERVHDSVALFLRHGGGDYPDGELFLREEAMELFGLGLVVGENNRLVHVTELKSVADPVQLVRKQVSVAVEVNVEVVNAVEAEALHAPFKCELVLAVRHNGLHETVHRRRERRGHEHDLHPAAVNAANETHELLAVRRVCCAPQQLVRLVDNDRVYGVHLEVFSLHDQVEHTADCANNDMPCERRHVGVRCQRDAKGNLQPFHKGTHFPDLFRSLNGKFACRGHNECLGVVLRKVDLLETGQGEGCSFTGSALRLDDDVVVCREKRRESPGLDTTWLSKAQRDNAFD